MEEVKTNSIGSKNFYLIVFNLLKAGSRPSKICKQLGITKQSLNYYLSSLKRLGFIEKVGYGTWNILKDFEVKQVKKTPQVANNTTNKVFTSMKPDNVRAHAFMFCLKLPKLANWNNRAEILNKNNIKFEPLGNLGGGQKIIFKGRNVHLKNNSILIYERSSFIADTAKEAKSTAIYSFLSIIKGLERLLGADLTINKQYCFKVSRQHYSLVKNALARQYDKEGNRLQVFNGSGLWLIIDNSYNLHELETLHPLTADTDNKKVQDFFNGLKPIEGFTPQFVLGALHQNAQNLDNYAVHLKAHVESVKLLGSKTEELSKTITELTKIVKQKHL